jgi:hypothetical protein
LKTLPTTFIVAAILRLRLSVRPERGSYFVINIKVGHRCCLWRLQDDDKKTFLCRYDDLLLIDQHTGWLRGTGRDGVVLLSFKGNSLPAVEDQLPPAVRLFAFLVFLGMKQINSQKCSRPYDYIIYPGCYVGTSKLEIR